MENVRIKDNEILFSSIEMRDKFVEYLNKNIESPYCEWSYGRKWPYIEFHCAYWTKPKMYYTLNCFFDVIGFSDYTIEN